MPIAALTTKDSRRTGVALGMRRLSIIDLSTGHQPIHNEDQTIWVVFNGEIYNYRELRDALEAAGPASTRPATLKRSFTATKSGVNQSFRDCAGCWDCVVGQPDKDLLVARDGRESSRSTTAKLGRLFSALRRNACSRIRGRSRLDPAALDHYLAYLYTRATEPSSVACASCLPDTSCSSTRARRHPPLLAIARRADVPGERKPRRWRSSSRRLATQ